MPAYTQSILSPDPLYLQPKSYDARSDRKWFADMLSPGIVGAGDYEVTATTSNMNIGIAAGVAYILGQNITDQGMYRQYLPSPVTMTVPSNSSGNPRIDTAIIRVMDNAADASTFNECRLEIVPGTPTSGADLSNLTGKANLATLAEASKSVLLLAYILVPTGATSLNTATHIADRRLRTGVGQGLAQGGGLPVGATLEWNSPTLPPGGLYLVEDGSAVSRTTYSQCFSIIGTSAGPGDGSTTFNLPDSQGRAALGLCAAGGHAEISTIFGNDGLPAWARRSRHRHTMGVGVGVSEPGHTHSMPQFPTAVSGPAGGAVSTAAGGSTGVGYASVSVSVSVTAGPQTGAEPTDMIPYIIKNKIIRVA